MIAYALLPTVEPPGYRVAPVPAGQDRARFMPAVPFSFSDVRPRLYRDMPEPIVLDVVRYGRSERLTRRERRQRARAKGRRRAVSVPVETRWEARIAAHADVPERVVQAFIEETAEVVERIWRR